MKERLRAEHVPKVRRGEAAGLWSDDGDVPLKAKRLIHIDNGRHAKSRTDSGVKEVVTLGLPNGRETSVIIRSDVLAASEMQPPT
jgi:hypothetical protein